MYAGPTMLARCSQGACKLLQELIPLRNVQIGLASGCVDFDNRFKLLGYFVWTWQCDYWEGFNQLIVYKYLLVAVDLSSNGVK